MLWSQVVVKGDEVTVQNCQKWSVRLQMLWSQVVVKGEEVTAQNCQKWSVRLQMLWSQVVVKGMVGVVGVLEEQVGWEEGGVGGGGGLGSGVGGDGGVGGGDGGMNVGASQYTEKAGGAVPSRDTFCMLYTSDGDVSQ